MSVFRSRINAPATTSDVQLMAVLKGVETTIENTIRSPVRLKLCREWRAPVTDPRLLLEWRPVNVADEDGTPATADPIVLSCSTPYLESTGTALTYGTQFVVQDLSSRDSRFSLAPILRAIGGNWWGWGGNQAWGGTWVRPPTRLANTLTSDPGRLRVTYWAGWPNDAIPESIREAAYIEAAAQWSIRKYGRLLSSESLNGYSYSTAPFPPPATGTVTKFTSQVAADMLQDYVMPVIAGIGPW